MLRIITALICGFIFAIGLGLSGMTQPQRVIAFLDLFGNWNPALAFVMIGAISVHAISYIFASKKSSPKLDNKFHVPTNSSIDFKLISGAVLFGTGWGLGGFCPGPALTSIASGSSTVLTFVISMISGMLLFKVLKGFGVLP